MKASLICHGRRLDRIWLLGIELDSGYLSLDPSQ